MARVHTTITKNVEANGMSNYNFGLRLNSMSTDNLGLRPNCAIDRTQTKVVGSHAIQSQITVVVTLAKMPTASSSSLISYSSSPIYVDSRSEER